MDIDDFLDREISELGLSTEETKKIETKLYIPQFKEDFQSSPLFEDAKSSLSRGNLDEAEQYYSQLWQVFTVQPAYDFTVQVLDVVAHLA